MTTQVSRFAGTKLSRGFKTDPSAEQDGVWRVHAEFGIWTRIRRATLPEHRRALRKHFKPFAHLTQIDTVDELRVKQKAAAEVLVADWGVVPDDADGMPVVEEQTGKPARAPMLDAEGAEIRPTLDNVLAAFVEMPDFFRWVADEADTFENYRVAVVEAAGGNSAPSSAGSGSGDNQAQLPSSSDELAAGNIPASSTANPS